jgi:hypothetical protein
MFQTSSGAKKNTRMHTRAHTHPHVHAHTQGSNSKPNFNLHTGNFILLPITDAS